MKEPNTFHKRNLPHIQPKGATFFVTYLLHDALPSQLKLKLQEEYKLKVFNDLEQKEVEGRRHFKRFDEALCKERSGTHCLKNPALAKIIADNLHFWDNKRYELISYCECPIMSMLFSGYSKRGRMESPYFCNR